MKQIQLILNAILSKDIFEYILVDRDLNILDASDGIEKYLGEVPKKEEEVVKYLPELVGYEDEIKKIFVQKYCLYSLEAVMKNGYFINITVEYTDNNTAIILLHNITAITKERQRLLQYSNESTLLYNTLQKVLDNQNALIFIAVENKITFANKKFMEYFGVADIAQLKEKDLKLYQYCQLSLNNYDELAHRAYNKERHIKIKDDIFIIQASDIESVHKLFTLTKVTSLSNEAKLDTLTGIYNKRYFNDILKSYIEEKKHFPLAILDIDDFKKINDTYGHLTGDQVLKEFVLLILGELEPSDLLARWGGEEFLIIFSDDSLAKAKEKLESIQQSINTHEFLKAGYLTTSFGLTCLSDNDDIYTIVERADRALYEAKIKGKNMIITK